MITLSTLFPFKLHMLILQLEGYDYPRFITWLKKNFSKRTISGKRVLHFTFKVYLIWGLSFLWLILGSYLFFLWSENLLYSLSFVLILLSQPYLLYGLSLLILKPLEYCLRTRIKNKTRIRLASFNNLKVIGITGSFGKSSTKEILFQLLKDDFEVLRTPESFNTLLGISKVVRLELNRKYQYFICEMGAYKKGEIQEICDTVLPDYGLITGITQQHLERFGNIDNIIKAKFELFDYVKDSRRFVFNLGNRYVEQELAKRGIGNAFGYGIATHVQVKVSDESFSEEGSSFTLFVNNKAFRVKSRLFGRANVQNITAAAAMALKLGVKAERIVGKIAKLEPIPHRLSLHYLRGSTLVDNTYSTNPSGFRQMLTTAKMIKGSKVLVTPGLVELGKEEGKIHRELGIIAGEVFDKIVLVGRNPRTRTLSQGISNRVKVEFIEDKREAYSTKVRDLADKYAWIFLENDVTDNY